MAPIPDIKHYSVATLVVFICIWTLCVATMFRTSFTDPGFLPQNLDPDPELHDLPSSASGISTLRPPETAAVSAYQKQNPTNPANFATSSVTTTSTTPPEHNGQQQHQQPLPPPQPPAATASSSSFRAPPAPPPSLPQGYPFITNANLPAYSMPFNPDPRTVYVNGIPLSVKFCVTCRIWRPPRASHCSVCDRCVSNHDHHCPWMANCVGKNNYKYFYGFICTTSLLAAYVFVFSLVALIRRARENGDGVETGVEGDAIGFWSAVEDKPANLVLMVYTFVIGWTVFGMAAYHTWIACNAFTTHEQIKERVRFDNSRITGTEHVGKSPFDRGNGCANWVWVICREGDVRFENWPADLEAGYLSGTMAMPPPPTTPTPGQVHPERSTT
ncbi:hypothetical protein HDU88_000264 [Geranomyces variabilis]|nr:hypothetical protein HDU88_000264 [Geranomyces variabilis]